MPTCRLHQIIESEEQHDEYRQPENQSRRFASAHLAHVLLVLLTERPVMKARKPFVLARLLILVVIDGTIVPLTGFLYFRKKYRHFFQFSVFSFQTTDG